MITKLLLLVALLLGFGSFAQFHDRNIPKITSLRAAQEYASRYKEVTFGIVNSELDVFLFDNVDTANLKASVGTISTVYRRRTKFLKDTTITMVNVQTIEFNQDMVNIDEANALIEEIIGKYKSGVSYWNLMKEYQGEKCRFSGGPTSTDLLNKRFGSTLQDRRRDEIFKWSYSNRPNLPIIIIIFEEAHPVPAFYAISYNVAG